MQVTDDMVEIAEKAIAEARIKITGGAAGVVLPSDHIYAETALTAALAAMWRPIESAPKEDPDRPGCMYRVMIAGGTFENSMSLHGEMEFKGQAIACWDGMGGDDGRGGWRGENSGGHDEYYWHKPTHWMPLPEPPATEDQG